MTFKQVYSFIFFFSFILGGCQTAEKEGVELPIAKEKMVQLLADIHLAEGVFKAKKQYKKQNINAEIGELYTIIYEKHFISPEKMDSINTFITQNPEVMLPVYEAIDLELKNRKTTFEEAIKNKEKDAAKIGE